MTEQQRQHLSALADGELDSELSRSTASALASNAELAATWERYHLIGSVLRRESVRPEYRDVSVRVREVLQTEPKIPAPSPVAKDPRLRAGPVLGMALAAGAAFFAVFALPQLVSDSRRA
jgi:sigma-E factor negative regulatory protein RseA